jgi:TRAP-type C4-dicarboxylate transport system permease small subunit
VTGFRNRLDRFLEAWVVILMAALALIVFVGVVFRKAGASLVWYDEVASITLCWLTYYGASLAALRRAHIGFPRWIASLSPPWRRGMLILRAAVVLPFFAVVAWAGWRVFGALDGFYMVSLPAVPQQFTQSVIPIGAVLFMLAEIGNLVQSWSEAESARAEATTE